MKTDALFTPAEVGRLKCATCGMIANVDPDFHFQRYGHVSTINVWSDVVMRNFEYFWVTGQQTFRTYIGEN